MQSAAFRNYQSSLAGATVVQIAGDQLAAAAVRNAMNPPNVRRVTPQSAAGETPVQLTVTTRVAEAILGASLATVAKGTAGAKLSSDIRFVDLPATARNVVAILPGSDPVLRNQYVAVGAHNDHVGYNHAPVDHDSLLVFNKVVRPEGADSPNRGPTPAEIDRVRTMLDSVRALRPARRDSIFNGADDDGSGTVATLEVAEAFARGNVKPKRSIIFIWHVGEEAGLWGSEYFTDNPTVPRDSIVAQLNMDMVGRGSATDVAASTINGDRVMGGPGYVQLVGSRRLSTQLGDLIETVNTEKRLGLKFDYNMDANGHPQNIYCRSDHYMYARYGIPVVFFTTGGHSDYHQVTDEPQYIDYERMTQVSKLVFESAMSVANAAQRVSVDKPKPDPRGQCRQ